MLQCCGQPSVTGFWDQHGQGLRGIFTGVRVSWSNLLAACCPFPSSSALPECPKLP